MPAIAVGDVARHVMNKPLKVSRYLQCKAGDITSAEGASLNVVRTPMLPNVRYVGWTTVQMMPCGTVPSLIEVSIRHTQSDYLYHRTLTRHTPTYVAWTQPQYTL